MAEGSKVRLVRCPRCQNLLSELPDYSVYQCGGCGAVLRAKKKVATGNGLPEKPGKEEDEEGFEKLESLSEKEGGGLVEVSENERENDEVVLHGRRKGRVVRERTVEFASASSLSRAENKEVGNLDNAPETEGESDGVTLLRGRTKERVCREKTVNFASSSLPRTENNEVLIDNGGTNMKEQNWVYQSAAEKGLSLKDPTKNWVRLRDGHDMNKNRSESVNPGRDKGTGQNSAQLKSSAGSLRSKVIADQWGLDRDGERIGNLRNHSKFSAFAYPDEGPSSYCSGSSYGHGKLVGNYNDLDSRNRVPYLELDPAELLKKLDELKEQLHGVHTMGERHREWIPIAKKVAPSDAYNGRAAFNVPRQPLNPDKHVLRSPYFQQYGHGPIPPTNCHDMDQQNFCIPQLHSPIHAYNNPFPPEMRRFPSHQPSHGYWHEQPHDYFLGQHMDFSEPLASYAHDTLYHQPGCSCIHCHNKNQHVPSQVQPGVFGKQKFPKAPSDSNLNDHANPATFRPKSCNPQVKPTSVRARDSQPHARWPVDIDSDIDGFCRRRPRKVVLPNGNERFCHPIAGGAPFVTCYNCFEMLKLPGELKSREKNQKLKCGACSKVFLLKTEKKRIIISLPLEKNHLSANVDCDQFSEKVLLTTDVCLDTVGAHCSDDFANPGYDSQSIGFKDNTLSDQRLNVSESEKKSGVASSSISSEENESMASMLVQRDVSYCAELPVKDQKASTFQDSPSQQHLEDFSNHEGQICGTQNRIRWKDQEKIILDKSSSRQNSVKGSSVATEVEVPPNEYLHTSFSQDSVEVSKDLSTINKGSESFFVGLIRNSFWDFSKSNKRGETGKPNVLVNGKPIPVHMIKKAEKLAGPIKPGDYWYDFQAGFWGVMGQPCLGIIPPFIEEFNYPMPENCSAGNTGVFVNGRELHRKDLDLLSRRGLPTMRDKYYMIEVSGRVFDKDSGKELNTLGKLAPTVERAKRGFGMRAQRNLA